MNISGLVRMGKDGEVRTTQSGKQLLSLVFVFDSGFGESKVSTWCEGVMFGDRGVKIADYIKRGQQIVVHGDNVSIESFQGKSGLQTKLKMNVISIELVARQSAPDQSQQAPAQSQRPAPAPAANQSYMAPQQSYDFDDDMDIPF